MGESCQAFIYFYFKINWSKKFWIIQLKSEVKSVMIHTPYQSFFWRQLQKLNESNDTKQSSRVQLNRKKTSFKVCDWNGFLTTCSVPLLTFLYESRESKHVYMLAAFACQLHIAAVLNFGWRISRDSERTA